ncbi:MAG: GNAT family N-acetyltransferase [Candidatus Methylomirabilales bacterium]
MASDVVIRDVRREDNHALIELDRQCVMGGEIQLVLDRSPDFFARSRAFDSSRMCVAEQEGTIIGVGAVAFKSLRVDGVRDRWAYLYDLRVRPPHRRRGVARLIGDALRDQIRTAGITASYSWVIEGNTPSESFVEGRGSVRFRRCGLALLSGSGGGSSNGFERTNGRGEEITSLLEATYDSHDFTPSWDAATLDNTFARLRPLGWQGIYGKRVQGRWAVCFGLWDYSPVMQMVFRGLGSETRVRPFFLYPLGWRDSERLREGLLAAQTMITRLGGTLLLPYIPGDPLSAMIPRETFRVGMTMYVRSLPGDGRRLEGNVFIDPADL